jgi:hypothetical protein
MPSRVILPRIWRSAEQDVARQPDHAHVVAEVLASELGANAGLARQLVDLLLELEVAEGAAGFVACAGQRIEVAAARELHRLESEFRRCPAHHDRQVVGRTGGRAERADLLVQEAQQRIRIQERFGLLVEESLVGRAAPLREEEKVVLVSGLGVDLDLRGQVRTRVLLLVHRERRQLRVAQVGLGVGPVDAA